VSSINDHFVFVPKRRKPVLVTDVARRLQEIIFELVQEHNWRLIALEIQPDHVHMFVNDPTDEAPSQIALRGERSSVSSLKKRISRTFKTTCFVDSDLTL
jgi:putative transposase